MPCSLLQGTVLRGGQELAVSLNDIVAGVEIYPLEPQGYLKIAVATLVWALVLRLTWRRAVLDQLLGMTISPFQTKAQSQVD